MLKELCAGAAKAEEPLQINKINGQLRQNDWCLLHTIESHEKCKGNFWQSNVGTFHTNFYIWCLNLYQNTKGEK